jgi:hypothetical protein
MRPILTRPSMRRTCCRLRLVRRRDGARITRRGYHRCMLCAATGILDRAAVLFGDHSYRSDLYQ